MPRAARRTCVCPCRVRPERRRSSPASDGPGPPRGKRNGVRSMSHAAAAASTMAIAATEPEMDGGDAPPQPNLVELKTTRFGTLTVDAERIITFPRGLLG